MSDLKITSTPKTPEINFVNGTFEVSGVSVPENAMEFYGVIINWLNEYVKSPCEKTKVVFKLTYVNTSSLQFLYDMLMALDEVSNGSTMVNIEWYYMADDDDMFQMGEDFKEAVSIDFSFIEVEDI